MAESSTGKNIMSIENDIKFLGKALDMASGNIKSGGGPFGAVIVRDGEIVSLSGNRVVEAGQIPQLTLRFWQSA
ncbi:MAG: hypothetical protein MZV63_34170 [Marinilabiliales bacterium]|nr:hypothetical protein [Marinilabiliales bacterium]